MYPWNVKLIKCLEENVRSLVIPDIYCPNHLLFSDNFSFLMHSHLSIYDSHVYYDKGRLSPWMLWKLWFYDVCGIRFLFFLHFSCHWEYSHIPIPFRKIQCSAYYIQYEDEDIYGRCHTWYVSSVIHKTCRHMSHDMV